MTSVKKCQSWKVAVTLLREVLSGECGLISWNVVCQHRGWAYGQERVLTAWKWF